MPLAGGYRQVDRVMSLIEHEPNSLAKGNTGVVVGPSTKLRLLKPEAHGNTSVRGQMAHEQCKWCEGRITHPTDASADSESAVIELVLRLFMEKRKQGGHLDGYLSSDDEKLGLLLIKVKFTDALTETTFYMRKGDDRKISKNQREALRAAAAQLPRHHRYAAESLRAAPVVTIDAIKDNLGNDPMEYLPPSSGKPVGHTVSLA